MSHFQGGLTRQQRRLCLILLSMLEASQSRVGRCQLKSTEITLLILIKLKIRLHALHECQWGKELASKCQPLTEWARNMTQLQSQAGSTHYSPQETITKERQTFL